MMRPREAFIQIMYEDIGRFGAFGSFLARFCLTTPLVAGMMF